MFCVERPNERNALRLSARRTRMASVGEESGCGETRPLLGAERRVKEVRGERYGGTYLFVGVLGEGDE